MSSGGANDGKEANDPNVIRITVDNVKDLDKISQTKRIDGFPWDLIVSRDGNSVMAQISSDKGNECAIWECEVEGEFKLVNRVDDSRSILKKFSDTVYFKAGYIARDLITWTNLIGDNEFVVDGNIVVEAKIVVKSSHGQRLRKRCQIDFFSPSKFSDVILIVEGKKFHVSKQMLAISSSYFESLFFGDFKESKKKEIELKDIHADEFVTALEIIYGTRCNMSYHTVEGQLRLAQQFDISKLVDEAEKWLLQSDCFPLHKGLLLADRYKLQVLQKRALDAIASFDDVTELKRSSSYEHYSLQVVDKLLEKTLELWQKENEGVMEVEN